MTKQKEIVRRHRSGNTLKEIAAEVGLTSERIRQILVSEILKARDRGLSPEIITKQFGYREERVRKILGIWNRCKRHGQLYKGNFCPYCKMAAFYQPYLSRLGADALECEIKGLAGRSRDREATIKRKILVRFLKEKKGIQLAAIGKRLRRDRTTILYLYRAGHNREY